MSEGFRRTIGAAILLGDGIGKPLGLLSPTGGVPICDTSVATQPGQLGWPDLFTEMDAISDALRANNPELRESLPAELQLEFRQLQMRRMPELTREQFLDLFHVWRDCYLARLEAEAAAVRRRMAENDCELRKLIAERDRHKPPSKFVCKCGAVIADPLEPKMLELHGPHFVAASLARTHEALQRWRAHYARQLK